jgi:hypothetical protein
MSDHSIEEVYHGFRLYGDPLPKTGDSDSWLFQVLWDDRLQFKLKIGITGTSAALDYGGRASASKAAASAGLHRVYGMIDLRRYEEGKEYEYWITSLAEPHPRALDQEIRQSLLQALYNIYQAETTSVEYSQIDVDGFCVLLGIDRATYEFNATVLRDQGYLQESPIDQLSIRNGGIFITAAGIDLIEKAEQLAATVDKLFSNTRSLVDSELTQVAPHAAAKLVEVYADLTDAQTSLKWKQIAFACRDILQDFTEAILLPENIPNGEERPRRDKTKNKLYLVLNAKAEGAALSESLRDFIKAQTDYLLVYFDKFNTLLQRNVHAEQISKADADRCVIYTYLLIAEVLSILGRR